jgi:uncharacterized protein with FMN-binding domain
MPVFGAFFGTVLLIGLKSPQFGTPVGAVADAPLDPGAVPDPAGGGGPGLPGPSGAPGLTPTPLPPGATPVPGQSTPGPGRTTAPPTGGTSTTTAPASHTFTGAWVAVKTAQSPTSKSSPCGDCHAYSMAVTITVTGGRITATSLAYNTSPGSSLSYASRANSTLSPKVLSAQTWNLGRVSGATYSGNAYELSLRDAMGKAGLPT